MTGRHIRLSGPSWEFFWLAILLTWAAMFFWPQEAAADDYYAVLIPFYDQTPVTFRDWTPTYTEERTEVPGEEVSFPFSEVVFFGFNSCDVETDYLAALLGIARMLDDTKATATLGGHTDERGEVDVNYRYGQCRIESVVKVLQAFGIETQQLHSASHGSENLAISDAETEEEHARNRRVTIDFTAITRAPPTVKRRKQAKQWQRRNYLGL